MYVPPKASYAEVLKDAVKNGYAVGQFNLNGLEYLQAIVEVAEEERSPVIRSSPVSCVNCPLRRMKGQVTQAFTTCSMAGSVDFCCSFFHCQYSSIFR
ncbi:class II fructose-bisphosphate aldolase [Hydrogenibacillus sp. N12]|uniref:class II fructose-bisphosphate aldolase n=1 Tax=Hydrogenibacillus sp. N12 TaxID=2866627 RepID=UPI0025A5BC5C|nr:class II fructose-bisphosphate aldolase [Hydrogenibacillus sp. N12]